jgi:hypothetical protein
MNDATAALSAMEGHRHARASLAGERKRGGGYLMAYLGKEDIPRLYITMDDLGRMSMRERACDLLGDTDGAVNVPRVDI